MGALIHFASPTMNPSRARFDVLCALLSAVLCFSSAHAGPIRDRLKERAEDRKAATPAKSDSDSLDAGDTGESCADWAAKVNRLEKLSRLRNPGNKADKPNVAYGPTEREKMDVFLPPEPLRGSAPIIVMVHGGGWCVGDKASLGVVENKLKRWGPQGFIFISLNYPMVDNGADALKQAGHVASAVAHIQRNAKEWGGDADKIILMGHSAGAHLVSLVNADGQIRKAANMGKVLGTVSLDAGAINVVKQMPNVYDALKLRYKEAFGTTEAGWIAASPYHQLDKGAAPWLGVCSTTRKDDPCGHAREYVTKSKSLGIAAEVLPQRKSHGAINKELGEPGAYTDAVEKFMAGLDEEVARRLKRSR